MKEITYRQATALDLGQILSIMGHVNYLSFRFGRQNTKHARETVKGEFHSRNFFVCALKNKILGYAIVGDAVALMHNPLKLTKKKYAYLMGIGVLPMHQGKKLGTNLLKHIVEKYQELGYIGIYSDVGSDNSWSIKFHLGLGFILVGSYKNSQRPKHTLSLVFLKKF